MGRRTFTDSCDVLLLVTLWVLDGTVLFSSLFFFLNVFLLFTFLIGVEIESSPRSIFRKI